MQNEQPFFDNLESATKTKIGKVSVQVLDDKTIWLEIKGEGAAFTKDCVEKVLTDFFYSNF